ncbi:transcriptional Coactivator p15-domain-containing protein [Lobosporangium transversale]|uniref:Transcriptional Coactivator p15-domain-containing protein n=1 Tax=Lobosporangium transversale TaxID=64571 RepID=A0A1Y2GQH7_9FUNG|nr:transcriptional Coactivator p15-domain-containing protein [Lobosporangium transversale]ORZ16174.1 transcriptional Coactivator p15-domain-containing protein [Lobosporangium transversale]|eukprot:XP_021881521.1 transcriptional Coactivator p15-domain-containing protein [Lobosporangium transversale]
MSDEKRRRDFTLRGPNSEEFKQGTCSFEVDGQFIKTESFDDFYINLEQVALSLGPRPPSCSRSISTIKGRTKKVSPTMQNERGERFFELGPKRRLTVHKWQNQTLVDIREHFYSKEGIAKPGRKGISLTIDQFKCILDHEFEIKRAIKSMERRKRQRLCLGKA